MDIFSSLNTYYNNPAGPTGLPENPDTTDPEQMALDYEQSFSNMLNSIFNSDSSFDETETNNSFLTMDQLGLGLDNSFLNIDQAPENSAGLPDTQQTVLSAEEFMNSVYNNLSGLFNGSDTQTNTFDSIGGYYNDLQNNAFSDTNIDPGSSEDASQIAQQLNAATLNSLNQFFSNS
ncbi:hypothetical protein ACFL57_04225 [Candidatus Margulisiibacteriota bacterium]